MASKVMFLSVLLTIAINFDHADKINNSLVTESLVNSMNQFGSDLLNGLYPITNAEDNLLVSPFNVYAALALLNLGAAGKTRQELSAVMRVPGNVIIDHSKLHEELTAILSQISPAKVSKPSKTKLANGIFLRKEYPIKTTYRQLAKKYYNSYAENVDFFGAPRRATDTINKWISDSTERRISKFYDEPLSSSTIAVLISAMYFKASWKTAFPTKNTKIEQFNTGLTEIKVPTMNMEDYMRYSHDDTLHYDSVSLPYAGEHHEMTIYLQHREHADHGGSLADLFHTLAEQNFAPSTSMTYQRRVDLKLPKMKFSWKKSLVSALKLEATFDSANLTEMTPRGNVEVSNMVHATGLEVDERGTIASTVTAIETMDRTARIKPTEFHVNRPYLVTITHLPSRIILFAGIVRKPTT